MTKIYIMIAFVVGMLFQNSLTGEHARYGFEVMEMIDNCEAYKGRECDIIAAPLSKVDFISSPGQSLS